uniref:Aquaporin n=1 Tax=Rhabditophanes sp. KR3021 TaxID=114890 RepID=A0AC35U9I3_9BILA
MRLWIASLAFYISIYAFCEAARFVVNKFDKNKHRSILVLLEFIGTIQICAPIFDVNFIMETYGLGGVAIEITFIELCNAYLLRDAHADPCPLVGEVMQKKRPWKWLTIILGAQFLGGYLSFGIAKGWWSLAFHPDYHEMLQRTSCEADLTVSVMYGMIVEFLGVICGTKIGQFIEKQSLDSFSTTLISASASGIICVVGIGLTGMYSNPIVAWATTFNCRGVSKVEHFLIYWIGPISAHYILGNFESEKEQSAQKIDGSKDEEKEQSKAPEPKKKSKTPEPKKKSKTPEVKKKSQTPEAKKELSKTPSIPEEEEDENSIKETIKNISNETHINQKETADKGKTTADKIEHNKATKTSTPEHEVAAEQEVNADDEKEMNADGEKERNDDGEEEVSNDVEEEKNGSDTDYSDYEEEQQPPTSTKLPNKCDTDYSEEENNKCSENISESESL